MMNPPPPPPSRSADNNYFKIVQTLEGNDSKANLCIVPALWEKGGELFWPKKTTKVKFEALMRNVQSCPQSDWFPVPAKVKQTSISSFKEATKILREMMEHSDTSMSSSENDEDVNLRKRRQCTINKVATQTSGAYTAIMVNI